MEINGIQYAFGPYLWSTELPQKILDDLLEEGLKADRDHRTSLAGIIERERGYPKEFVEKFYPTSVLVTGFDIIFFWVARMMMFGMEFLNKEPFKDIYVHALVRDEKGQKMSKSKGNVIDPLELIEKYSADALRFTLLSMASPGRDVKLSEDRVKGYRNFLNKLWNANNFLITNECDFKDIDKVPSLNVNINKWIYLN